MRTYWRYLDNWRHRCFSYNPLVVSWGLWSYQWIVVIKVWDYLHILSSPVQGVFTSSWACLCHLFIIRSQTNGMPDLGLESTVPLFHDYPILDISWKLHTTGWYTWQRSCFITSLSCCASRAHVVSLEKSIHSFLSTVCSSFALRAGLLIFWLVPDSKKLFGYC